MTKYKTNEQKIKALFKNNNPMIQAFVMDAIHKQAAAVVENDGKDWPENSLVSFELWKHCAEACLAELFGENTEKKGN